MPREVIGPTGSVEPGVEIKPKPPGVSPLNNAFNELGQLIQGEVGRDLPDASPSEKKPIIPSLAVSQENADK